MASLVPSGENLQNHTSSECSVKVCIVTQGNVCLNNKTKIQCHPQSELATVLLLFTDVCLETVVRTGITFTDSY